MFPLAFGLVPETEIPSVTKFIKSRGMACSVYGAQYLMEALYNVGEDDYRREEIFISYENLDIDKSFPNLE